MAFSDREELAKGWTSTIYIGGDIDPDKVIKVVDRAVHKETTKENLQPLFDGERKAYEKLTDRETGSIPVIDYFGIDKHSEYGLILSRVENGDLYRYLYETHIHQPKDEGLLIKWAKQAAIGLAFCHDNGVLHCDIHTANSFLDKNLDLKIGDFGAASVDGSRPPLMYRSTHQLWIDDGRGGSKKDISVKAEIFAFGCFLYEIEARHDAFHDLEDDVVKERLQKAQMPGLDDLPTFGSIISKCWRQEYDSMRRVIVDINAINMT